MLCKIFLRVDSVRFPVKTYGDMGYVIFGAPMKHFASMLQSLRALRPHMHPPFLLT